MRFKRRSPHDSRAGTIRDAGSATVCRGRLLAVAWLLLGLVAAARAHEPSVALVELELDADRHWRLELRFDDSQAIFSDEFIVFDECSEEVIIGATTMQKWQIRLDFKAERVRYRMTAQRLRV